MNETMKAVLSLSLSGTLLILLIFLFRPLFKERLSKRWQYYIWLVVVARLLLPFAPETNLMATLFQGIDRTIEQTEIVSPYTQQGSITQTGERAGGQNNLHSGHTEPVEQVNNPVKNTLTMVWKNLWLGWLVVALVLFIRKITVYQDFVKYIRSGCVEVADIDLLERFGKLIEHHKIKTTVELYTNNLISSPLLIGFFRPSIVLPSADLSPIDFEYTLLHELTHFKRWDMFYKWLVQFSVCVHWFNPLVYVMSSEVGRICELSCDETVIRTLDLQERRAYGDTLLNAMEIGGNYKDSFASITLNESKELLKERLDAIMNFKRKTKWGIFTSLIVTVLLVCGFAFLGAYTANTHSQTNSNVGMDTISLYTNSAEIGNEQIADDSPLFAQIYDYYRTYEQTKLDIQNGYIVNTGVSFSEQAMPMVINRKKTSFYVNHDNSIDISITLKNLIDGTGRDRWTPDSFVSFEVYDPSGKVAYSFNKKGKNIENAVDIDTELVVYPGEWQYKISFAYTTNGVDTSDMEIALRYKTIFEDDIKWLVDNKLNKIN